MPKALNPGHAAATIKLVTRLTVGIVDVFADAPLQGNPLAVVEGADALSEEQMRRIAGEFNQAETTFILSSDCADRKLRSFTAAGAEVFGAGHNALGAWLWLGERGDLGDLTEPKIFRQEIGDDVLPIELQVLDNRVHGRMQQAPLRLFEPLADLQPLAKALGLEEGDLLAEPPTRPANTGATHLMVRARSHEDVDKARPNAEALLEVLKGTPAEGCYLYAFDVGTPDKAYARFFNPTVGLWEDAATGTAAGPLSGYLAAEGLAGEVLSIEQGTTMGRRSILELRPKPNPILSGAGVVVLIGTMSI